MGQEITAMKLNCFLAWQVLAALMIISSSASAQRAASDVPRWQTKTPTRVAHLTNGCSFYINDLQKGAFSINFYANKPDSASVSFAVLGVGNGDMDLGFRCRDRNEHPDRATQPDGDAVSFILGATQVNGEWRPADGREQVCNPMQFPPDQRRNLVQDAACFYPNENFKILALKGKNWRGIGTLLDMTTGEPKRRQRRFRYCLFPDTSPNLALCGGTYVRYLSKPRSDVLQRDLKVLSSMEFVNTPTEPAAAQPEK